MTIKQTDPETIKKIKSMTKGLRYESIRFDIHTEKNLIDIYIFLPEGTMNYKLTVDISKAARDPKKLTLLLETGNLLTDYLLTDCSIICYEDNRKGIYFKDNKDTEYVESLIRVSKVDKKYNYGKFIDFTVLEWVGSTNKALTF